MRILLLALAVGFACADSQINPARINGEWRSIAEAADNVEKIQEGGPLRAYLRSLNCFQGCRKLSVNFYVKLNEDWREFSVLSEKRPSDGVYTAVYSGQNFFNISSPDDGITVFSSTNVDENGRRTRLLLLGARKDSLTQAEESKFRQLAVENGIPEENIVNLADSDTYPN
ncbi:lipocalin Cav p 3.0101 [Fukomys damarensis]|uniref:lipocalin Cav p 3.0101 n=1 Tax=Fukomys damarensis TaxID=885580 RepID=UPI00053F8DCF|nr:lipocalin Cav p 3.0101 [Fukomys damarensis]